MVHYFTNKHSSQRKSALSTKNGLKNALRASTEVLQSVETRRGFVQTYFAEKPFVFGQEAAAVLHSDIQCSPLHFWQRNAKIEAEREKERLP